MQISLRENEIIETRGSKEEKLNDAGELYVKRDLSDLSK